MKALPACASSAIRVLSPRIAPPPRFDEGSMASTAICRPSAMPSRPKRSIAYGFIVVSDIVLDPGCSCICRQPALSAALYHSNQNRDGRIPAPPAVADALFAEIFFSV